MKIETYNSLKFKIREGSWDDEILGTEVRGNEYLIPEHPKLVIDIGAHIGGTTIRCASLGARVLAFEPDPENYALLVENVELNGLQDKVTCINKAVGTNNKIFINGLNRGSTGAYGKGEQKEVETITLKEIFDTYQVDRCDFLKLDCEGGEYDILPDALPDLHDKIEQIGMELHFAVKEHQSNELKEKYGFNYTEKLESLLGKYFKVFTFPSGAASSKLLVCKSHSIDRINFFGFHTTTKAQRDMMMYERPFEIISVDPTDIARFPQIIWDQDRDVYYEFSIKPFTETFEMFDKFGKDIVLTDTPIWKEFSYKGQSQMTRLEGLYDLYQSIKQHGILRPICIERTGERFDGSYRMMIANHLKLPQVKAQLFTFKWQDVDEEFLKRKLIAHEKAFGVDYYQFEYKPGMWNVQNGGQNYKDNAKERWDFFDMFLQDLNGRTVLDLGCNEGYLSINMALKGAKVIGYEYDKAREANAWLNKLIFEWVNQKDIDVEFRCEDFTKAVLPKTDVTLMLNVLYHINDRDEQKRLLRNLSGTLILQCNLRKIAEREYYFTSHPDDAIALLREMGWEIKDLLDFGDKPIIVATKK